MGATRRRVVIVGAGPVGLVAARLLHEAGIPFVLLEKAEALPEDLRASTFHPPTLDMLAPLGVTEALIARGLITRTWQIRLHPSGERVVFDLDVIAGDTDYPFRLQCTQSTLCNILLEDLQARGADIRLGVEALEITQDDEGVSVRCRSTGGEVETIDGAWLVGADGARSLARRAVDASFEGATYPETVILATTRFPFQDHLEGLSNVNYVWREGGTFSLLRLPDTWRCSLYPDADETIEEATTLPSITRKLDLIVPGAGAFGVDEVRPYRIHRRIVDRYRSGRIVLAGDAAHLNSPSGGMGMNGGIHDAFELVAALRKVFAGEDDSALDLYAARRRPVALAEILTQADRNRSRMQERDPQRRVEMLSELQAIAADPVRARDHLLRTSMITGLRQAAEIQ